MQAKYEDGRENNKRSTAERRTVTLECKRAKAEVPKIIAAWKETNWGEPQLRATYEDLARTIGVDRTTIRRNIAVLKEKGVIRRVGEDKNGYWGVLISIENVV